MSPGSSSEYSDDNNPFYPLFSIEQRDFLATEQSPDMLGRNSPSGPAEPKGKSPLSSSMFYKRTGNRRAPSTVRFDRINELTGHLDYDIWSATMRHLFRGMGVWEIINDSAKPNTLINDDILSYNYLSSQAITALVQVVSIPIRR